MKTLEQIENEKATFSISTALSEGWSLVSKFLLFYILAGIIVVVISVASGLVPIVGSIANALVLSPCLTAGGIYVTWQISNGRAWTDFGDMFKGFNFLTPLLVSTLIKILITLVLAGVFLASYIPEIWEFVKLSSGGGSITNQEEIKDLVLSLISGKTIILFLLAMLVTLFISIIWAFASHFIVIYKLQAWPAMEASRKIAMRNFFELFGLFILLGIIIILSALPCGIGLLFTLPWMIGAVYSAFSQITNCNNAFDIKNEGFDFMKEEEDSL